MANKIEKEMDMKNSENLYRVTIDSMTDMIHVLDADFNFLVLNQAMRDWLKKMNIVPDEIIGKNIFDIFPFLGDKVKDEYRHLFASGVPVSTIETTMINHQEVITETKKSPIFENGSITRVITVISDITKLKHNEKKIKKSEERYKNFISQVNDGVYRYEMNKPMPLDLPVEEQIDFFYDHMTIAECNSAFMEMYGIIDQKDIIGKSQTDLHGGKDNPVNRKAMGEFINSGYRGENVITEETDADGAVKYFNNNAIGIIENNYFVRMWGTQTDISEQKLAEKALKENEAKQNAMISNISDVIGILDKNGIIKYKSPNIEKIFGWEPEELVGESGWSTVHPDDLKRIQQVFFELIKTEGASLIVEYRYKIKNGSYKPIQLTAINLINNPHIQGILLNYRDITERRQAEKIKEESEQSYRTLAENMTGLVYRVLSNENNKMIFFNNLVEEMTGYKSEELVIGEVCSIVPYILPQEREQVVKIVEQAVKNKTDFELEYRFIHKNGSIRHFYEKGKPIFNTDGSLLFIDGIILDNTHRKHAEEKLKFNEQRFKDISEIASDYFWELDAQLRYSYISDSYEKFTGKKPHEILGKTRRGMYIGDIPEDKEAWIKFLDTLDVHKDFRDFEYTYVKPDGQRRVLVNHGRAVFDPSGKFLGYRGIGVDITERKKAERALRVSEEKFRSLFENMSIGCSIWKKQEDEFILSGYNSTGATMDSLNKNDIINKTAGQLFPDPVQKFDIIKKFKNCLSTGEPEFIGESSYMINKKLVWREIIFTNCQMMK